MKILEKDGKKLKILAKGWGHTFLNLLRDELHNDSDVLTAAYTLKHPLVPKPTLVIKTKKKDPKKAIRDAIKRIKAKNKEFASEFKKLIK